MAIVGMGRLGSREMTNVLVEGGASVLGSLFDQRLVDMVHVFVGPSVIGGEHAWPAVGGEGCEALSEAMRLVDAQIRQIDADAYICGRLGS